MIGGKMDLILTRNQFRKDGIFGHISDESGDILWATLEHAYPIDGREISFSPKLIAGDYLCVRGNHRLENGGPFETFEIIAINDGTLTLLLTRQLRQIRHDL